MKQFGAILEGQLRSNSQFKTMPADTVLVHSSSRIRSLPIVLSGSMRVMREDEDGREILLYYLKPGETCIISFLAGIQQGTSKVKLIVEEDSEVLMLPIEKAIDWIKIHPDWADFIFKLHLQRFEELLEVINAVAFQKLDDRIVTLLKRKAGVFGSNEVSITHQQLAQELGTTREVVSRLLKQMEKQHLITLSRHKITLIIPL